MGQQGVGKGLKGGGEKCNKGHQGIDNYAAKPLYTVMHS